MLRGCPTPLFMPTAPRSLEYQHVLPCLFPIKVSSVGSSACFFFFSKAIWCLFYFSQCVKSVSIYCGFCCVLLKPYDFFFCLLFFLLLKLIFINMQLLQYVVLATVVHQSELLNQSFFTYTCLVFSTVYRDPHSQRLWHSQ